MKLKHVVIVAICVCVVNIWGGKLVSDQLDSIEACVNQIPAEKYLARNPISWFVVDGNTIDLGYEGHRWKRVLFIDGKGDLIGDFTRAEVIEPNCPVWGCPEVELCVTCDPHWDENYVLDFIDDTISYAEALTITCGDGNEVVIDLSGDEVKVIGATEEGARIFFNEYLKGMMDNYCKSKCKDKDE